MSTQQIIQILQTYSDNFNLDTLLGHILRELGWFIVQILAYIVDAINTVVDELFQLDSFYNNPDVVTFINSFKPLIVVLFAVSICTVGYQLMFSQNKQFRKVGVNFLIAITVVLLLPTAMDKLNAITGYGVSAVNGGSSPNLANQIIKDNIVDLLLYDKANFNADAIKQLQSGNGIDVKNIRYIDPTALVEPDLFNTMHIQNQDVFQNRLTLSVNGDISTAELNQGWMTFWKEYYYRYSINFLNIIVALAVIGATLAFTCFKLGRLIFELGYNKLLAILVAPADINNGQRTKQIIQNIVSIFIVTFLIAVLLQFYVLFIGMCANIKGMEYLVLMVAGSFAVIEGPNMVEKIFGIDAGLHSGFKTMMGAYLAGKAIMGGAGAVGNVAKSVAGAGGKTVGSVIGGTAGAVSGFASGNKKADSNGIYTDMDKGKSNANANGNTAGGKSLYNDMNKKGNKNIGEDDTNKGNGNEMGGDITTDTTASPISSIDSKGLDKENDSNKISGSPKSPSLYTEMGGNSNGNNKAGGSIGKASTSKTMPTTGSNPINSASVSSNKGGSKKPSSLYTEMGNNGGSHGISENPIENTTAEPISTSSGSQEQPSVYSEMGSNGGHTTEPIRTSGNTPKSDDNNQTIGQYTKNKIREKIQNNGIYKQTVKSYNLGKNTAQSIKNRNNNKK